MAKTPAPASPDFCATLLQAIKAAEASPEGTKSLAADAAKTGKYYRDYFHDGSIMNASLQIGGALQTNVRKSSFGYYNLHVVMEDLEHDSDIAPKYEAWQAAVADCIKAAGRPLKAYYGADAVSYYESGAAVVKVEYVENWAGTHHTLLVIEVHPTAPTFKEYRRADSVALRSNIYPIPTGAAASSGGKGEGGNAGAAKEETHLFFAICGGVQTLCKVYANMSKHPFPEVQAKAASQLSGRSCGSIRYVGKAGEVQVPGTPGRDYVVTEATIMDF